MTQSTNIQPEVEPHDDRPHLVEVRGDKIGQDEETRYVYFNDLRCGHQHRFEYPWHHASGNDRIWTITGRCPDGQEMHNTELKVSLPYGYHEYWHQGHAVPGTDYPSHEGSTSLPFNLNEAYDHGNPTGNENCPAGCIRDHSYDPAEPYHNGPVWTNNSDQHVGKRPKFTFRTQHHHVADPRDTDSYNYVTIEVFDSEFDQWHEMNMLTSEVQQLANILQDHVDGKAHLAPRNPAEVADSE